MFCIYLHIKVSYMQTAYCDLKGSNIIIEFLMVETNGHTLCTGTTVSQIAMRF